MGPHRHTAPLGVIPFDQLAPLPPLHTRFPATQFVVPKVQMPASVPHVAPPPGLPSSTVPSQSLSVRSHTSAPVSTHAYSQPVPGRPSMS